MKLTFKVCAKCQEKNNPSFEYCWKCDASFNPNEANLKRVAQLEKCPKCLEIIIKGAHKCKHCRVDLAKIRRKKNWRIAGLVSLLIIVILKFPFLSSDDSQLKETIEINDRVTVVDGSKQLTAFLIGGNSWSYMFGGKGKMLELPDSQRAHNEDKGSVVKVGCEKEIPHIRYFTDGTKKVDGYSCVGETIYNVRLDRGITIRIKRDGLSKEWSSRLGKKAFGQEPNFISVDGKIVPNPKKRTSN